MIDESRFLPLPLLVGAFLHKHGRILRKELVSIVALTAKQENFAQAVAGGMNQSDAYRSAYNAGKMKPDVVNVKASQLASDGKVAVRLQELKAELANKSLWTREQSVAVLIDVIGDGDSKAGDKINSVKVLNEMQGFNAPTKHDLTHNFPRVINVIAGRA